MNELVFTLNKEHKHNLGGIRCMQDLKVAEDDDQIWLRGLYDDGKVDKSIRQLPLKNRYHLDENNLLFSPGGLTPLTILPMLQWFPVTEFISIEIPVAALPGQLQAPAIIRVVPSAINKNGTALLTTLEQWKIYAEYAPAIRLAQLQFAMSQKNEVLIVGTPLPPIPGNEYWRVNNMLLPCGFDLEIPIAAALINEKLNPQQDGLLIFNTDGKCEKIDFAFLVAAKRSAVRLTQVITKN